MKRLPENKTDKKFIIFMDDPYENVDFSKYDGVTAWGLDWIEVGKTYLQTEKLISERKPCIITESMAHFSFDLIDLGYDIFLMNHYGKSKKIFPGMSNFKNKDIKRANNIFVLFRAGFFYKDYNDEEAKDFDKYVEEIKSNLK